MHELWYDYVKPKHGEKAKICCVETDCFTTQMKTNAIYIDTAEYLETRFESSNYELTRPLTKGNNNKVMGVIKDELDGKIMKELVKSKKSKNLYLLNK